MPTRFIASRSAVMPSFVMLPFIQCHQVCGLAESGGAAKPRASSSAGSAANEVENAPAKKHKQNVAASICFIAFPVGFNVLIIAPF